MASENAGNDGGAGDGASAAAPAGAAADAGAKQGTAASNVEQQQQAKLAKKYGGLPSRKAVLDKQLNGRNVERTYFDSADHFSGKETGKKAPTAKNPALARLRK